MASVAHAHGKHAAGHGDPNSPFHIHHPNVGTYIFTYVVLLVLLIVTVGLYYVDLQKIFTFIPGINLIVALIVACIKAGFVVMNFMNVKGGTKLIWLWAGLGFLWLLFMGGIFMDYGTRQWVNHTGWQMVPSEPQPTMPTE